MLAYASKLAHGQQIRSVNPDGTAPALFNDRQEQLWPRVSPDGTRVAWLQIDVNQGADIWVADLARGTRTRVTTTPGRDIGHVWAPDGRQLAHRYDLDEPRSIRIVASDGSGDGRSVTCPRSTCEPTDWSADGRELIVNSYEPGSTDVWAVAVGEGGTSRPLLQTRFNERDARLSPNQQWLAYVSDEGGQPDVAVTIGSGHSNTQYDVAPNGRIYYLDPGTIPAPTEIRLVLGWQRLLKP